MGKVIEALVGPGCPGSLHRPRIAPRRHFDRWSRTYGRDPTSRWLAERQREALLALELGAGDSFLDVGCGTGAAVREAAPLVARAAGVDLSPAMVARARKLNADPDGVEFREGDSEALPFDTGEFTAILCTTSFHHYPEPEVAVKEMFRVLAPGGRVVIGDLCSDNIAVRGLDALLRRFQRGHVRFHRSAALRAFLRRAGFASTASRSQFRGAYAIVSARRP